MNKYFCETKEVNKMESVLFDVDTFIKTLYEYKPNNIFNSKFSNSYPCWVIVNYLPGNRIKYFANGWADKTPIIEDLKDVYTSWKIQGLKYCYFNVEDQSDKNDSNEFHINDLTKEELLSIRNKIDLRLESIEKESDKNPLRLKDLKGDSKILCLRISVNGNLEMDYTNIKFIDRSDVEEYVGFSTSHPKKPLGCSSSILRKYMDGHCFLSDFTSSIYFFTLKPETWEEDLNDMIKQKAEDKNKNYSLQVEEFISRASLAFSIKDRINNKINQVKDGFEI